jgi:hypothetical protein
MNFEIAPKSTEIQSNWHNDIAYCDSLNIGGKTGWRLPTKAELNKIYKSENDFTYDYYWSSTEHDGNYVWNQYFDGGSQGFSVKLYGGNYVRAIRSTV